MRNQYKTGGILCIIAILTLITLPGSIHAAGLDGLQTAISNEAIGDTPAATIQNSTFVVLRSEPRLESAPVAVIHSDEKLTLISREGAWVKISCSKGTGYMRTMYFKQPQVTTTPATTPTVSTTPATSTLTDVSAPPVSTPTPAGPATTVKKGTKILAIGDSHSVGIYGSELDRLLRATGASVRSVGVSGSSPSWWWRGTVTKSGYVDRKVDGSKDQPKDWRTPRATPSYAKLLQDVQPDLVIISLGANMLGASAGTIKKDCGRLISEARNAGAEVIWVGPPDARSASSNQTRAKFYTAMADVVNGQATLIDARKFTKYPSSGGDGVHYWGKEGSATAKSWAANVMKAISNR